MPRDDRDPSRWQYKQQTQVKHEVLSNYLKRSLAAYSTRTVFWAGLLARGVEAHTGAHVLTDGAQGYAPSPYAKPPEWHMWERGWLAPAYSILRTVCGQLGASGLLQRAMPCDAMSLRYGIYATPCDRLRRVSTPS